MNEKYQNQFQILTNTKQPSFSPSKNQEGVWFDFDEAGPRLTIRIDRPTVKEIADIRRGNCEFALVEFGPILMLLSKFGNEEWMDAPYSIQMLPAGQRNLNEEYQMGKRYQLAVLLYDLKTDTQKGARLVSLSVNFSQALHLAAERQKLHSLSRSEYLTLVGRIYEQYPTADDMLNKAIARCFGSE